MNPVLVELRFGKPYTIFKTEKSVPLNVEVIVMEKADAVRSIRDDVWFRQDGECLRCGEIITKPGFHMHERVHKGRGGLVSLDNAMGLCYSCHLGKRGVHPEKQVRFGETVEVMV